MSITKSSKRVEEVPDEDRTTDYVSYEMIIPATVIHKGKDYIVIDYRDDFVIHLDEVKCNFVPFVDDKIYMRLKENECVSVYPMEIIRTSGIITKTGENHLLINNNFLIDKNNKTIITRELEVGTLVYFEAIVNVHMKYRVVKVYDKPPNWAKSRANWNYDNFIKTECGPVTPGNAPSTTSHGSDQKIPVFEIPEILVLLVLTSNKSQLEGVISTYLPHINSVLTMKSYQLYFHSLLYLEEIYVFQQMRHYDIANGTLKRHEEYLKLFIKGLQGRQPRLCIGDSIIIVPLGGGTKRRAYQGFIHKLVLNDIYLKFDDEYQKSYNGEACKMVFQFSRMNFRKYHHAIDTVVEKYDEAFLFPTEIQIKEGLQLDVSVDENGDLLDGKTSTVYPWHNKNLNDLQKQGVANILRGEARTLPYIVFGPPGTGKTCTAIETIIQLINLIPSSRILVGTANNNLANSLLEVLATNRQLNNKEIVRIVSYNLIENEKIPDAIAPFCVTLASSIGSDIKNMKINAAGIRLGYPMQELRKARVVIGTCLTLGSFFKIKLSSNFFSHLIIDDAGQCCEPDLMIPIAIVDKQNGQIVLTGDPMQLNPVVLNVTAANKGLAKSFLVRLFEQPAYSKNSQKEYDSRLVTTLLNNYRSIPSILNIYNELFYDGKLVPTIRNENVDVLLWGILDRILPNFDTRNKDCGFFFNAVYKQSLQLPGSTSWYNPTEAELIVNFVQQLYGQNFKVGGVGIVSFYRAQIEVISNIFKERNLPVPKIATTEEFQGQEKDIIIISTVRSLPNKKYLTENDLGFLNDPKRLNVAISRARILLMVFGNPKLLSLNPYWKRLIEISIVNNTCCNL